MISYSATFQMGEPPAGVSAGVRRPGRPRVHSGWQERDVSLLVFKLHGEAALDDALGGQLLYRGAHPDHLHLRDGVPDEDGRQDPVAEDQQPGLVRRQPPQEQHGGGGGDGAAAAPGRNRCAPSLHHLCLSVH